MRSVILQEFAEKAVGAYVPVSGPWGAAVLTRAWHAAKVDAACRYVIEFIALDGWPPKGRHLVYCRAQGVLMNFPSYRGDVASDEYRQLVNKALVKSSLRASQAQKLSLSRLEQINPFLAACVHEFNSQEAARLRRSRWPSIKEILELGGSLLFVVCLAASMLVTIWAFVVVVLPDLVSRFI